MFCGPCIEFLKNSTSFRKILLTALTLIVTSLLVASPILFLISAAPSIPHNHREDCMLQSECIVNSIPIPECTDDICQVAARTISSNINWTSDACNNFKSFCCSDQVDNGVNSKIFKSPQEIVDQNLLGKQKNFKVNFELFLNIFS